MSFETTITTFDSDEVATTRTVADAHAVPVPEGHETIGYMLGDEASCEWRYIDFPAGWLDSSIEHGWLIVCEWVREIHPGVDTPDDAWVEPATVR
tara:strand:- start:11733 stop:12017 length:285 start_codon:yes stop_codon:yes gene_type:complete